MLKRVEFILEEKWSEVTSEEAQDTAEKYRTKGIGTGAYFVAQEEGLPAFWEADPAVLYLADSDRLLGLLQEAGAPAAGYSHAANREETFAGVKYILEEPAFIDKDSLEKIWQRLHGMPWRILMTEHCIVREFRTGDLDAIYALYDEEARRWLEPPSPDRKREAEILKAYIDRIYGLYGYGQWAVLDRGSGRVIGRMGFSFPPEELPPGVSRPDAALGYLLAPAYRGKGLAREVCGALLEYGFAQLEFKTICAEIDPDNAASAAVAVALGFVPCGTAGRKQLYLKEKK